MQLKDVIGQLGSRTLAQLESMSVPAAQVGKIYSVMSGQVLTDKDVC